MNKQQQLADIIANEKENAILHFIKNLTEVDKKELAPFLKKQYAYYEKYVQVKKNSWSVRGTEVQRKILDTTAFFLFSMREFRTSAWGFRDGFFDKLLEIHQPKWFNDYINSFAESDWLPNSLNYLWLMEQIEKGRVQSNELLLAKTLAACISKYSSSKRGGVFTPSKVEQYDITLKEHFWYFFQYETNVYNATRWAYFTDGTKLEEGNWLYLIVQLEKKGKLPRNRVIKEALAATTRNFNRNLINWYIDIVTALEPTKEELLALQEDLFQVFHSAHSKPINAVLKWCKQLAKEPEFDKKAFLENAPILLTSETKSIVNSTLMVLDKIASKAVELRAEICQLACDTFLHQAANLQNRAAKIIAKYGKVEDAALQAFLTPFQPSILSEARTILKDFWTASEKEAVVFEEEITLIEKKVPILSAQNAIAIPQNFDDVAFLANQALLGTENWQLEVLPAALLQFQNQLTVENIEKLKPAFQRAYKFIFAGVGSARIGNFENMLAHFLGEYVQIIEKQPSNLTVIKKMLEKYLEREKQIQSEWQNYQLRRVSLNKWKTYYNDSIYQPIKQVLLHALNLLKNKSKLPLLSTPTHAPYWIDPMTFVQRLLQYQKAGEVPNHADWQLAISRIAFENLTEAVELAKQNLKEEFQELTLFLLSNKLPENENFEFIQEWKVAALTKNQRDIAGMELFFPKEIYQKYLGNLDYSFDRTTRWEKQYNYKTSKYEKVLVQDKELLLDNKKHKPRNIFSMIWEGFKGHFAKVQNLKTFFLYENLDFYAIWSISNEKDVAKILSLVPNTNTAILAKIIKACFCRSEYWGQTHKSAIRFVGQNLLGTGLQGNTMEHLFIANTIVGKDKINRSIAAELWLKGVKEQSIDNQQVGKMLGEMSSIEFFPLKRLLDTIQEQLFQVSKQHNKALFELLTAIIIKLPETPIRNTKRLLEIYTELLALNEQQTPRKVIDKLQIWESNNGLKKVIGRINHFANNQNSEKMIGIAA